MKSKIKITPVQNIVGRTIIDNSLIIDREFDTNNDSVHLTSMDGKTRITVLMDVSIYNDLITIDNITYKILSMISS